MAKTRDPSSLWLEPGQTHLTHKNLTTIYKSRMFYPIKCHLKAMYDFMYDDDIKSTTDTEWGLDK